MNGSQIYAEIVGAFIGYGIAWLVLNAINRRQGRNGAPFWPGFAFLAVAALLIAVAP